MKKIIIAITFLFWISSPGIFAQQKNVLQGHWEGAIDVMNVHLDIKTDFKTEDDSLKGTIDIPDQGAFKMVLSNISIEKEKVHFDLISSGSTISFDGKLDSDSLTGNFLQAGISGNFYLAPKELPVDETIKTELLPYIEEEVSFNNGNIKFAGTMTIPKTPGKRPAVVMITGSGPQNRDEELFGFKPFGIIADYFSRNGIIVLRYDDEETGGSTGKNVSEYTTMDFAGDVLAAVNFLKTRPEVNDKQIGLCGHSEGGIIAPICASKSSDVAFIILMAGTGVTGKDLILKQEYLILKAKSVPEITIKERIKLEKKIFNAINTGTGLDEIKEYLYEEAESDYANMTAEEKKAIKNKDEFFETRIKNLIESFQSTWFKYFLKYDPVPTLENVKCPVLMLFGEKDLQVPPSQNKSPMENALKNGGNKVYTSVVFPNANHLFLYTTTGNPEEYSKLKKEFVDGFLDTMTKWIHEKMK